MSSEKQSPLERLLDLETLRFSTWSKTSHPEIYEEYESLKKSIEQAMEKAENPTGTLKAYMKMLDDVIEERNHLLKNQRTDKDKQNQKIVDEIRSRIEYHKGIIENLLKNGYTETSEPVMEHTKYINELQSLLEKNE